AAAAPAEPALAAPWRDIDFRATDDELANQLIATPAPGCARGSYEAGGLCWGSNDVTGDQIITIYFESSAHARRFAQPWGSSVFASVTADEPWQTWHLRAGPRRVAATLVESELASVVVLEELMPLREAVPWMKSLVGLSHDAVAQKLGKRGSHRQPVCEGILCFFTLPPNEGGDVIGSVEFDRGIAVHASYVVWCDRDCALGPRILRAFDAAFGARTTASRPYEETGELWTYRSYARRPGLVIKSREYAPEFLFVCVGACD
ncbi:MAG: hypothetical protein M3680_36065, partial [Myxococcota bacterium]|nr:hypothetical protein [Myxococcota bacterium]